MDTFIQNLVANYGVGFFKFDYNIQVMQGTDIDGPFAAGAAQLEHQRAYLAWVRPQLEKYPNLVIETCSSGARRLDYAMLALLQKARKLSMLLFDEVQGLRQRIFLSMQQRAGQKAI